MKINLGKKRKVIMILSLCIGACVLLTWAMSHRSGPDPLQMDGGAEGDAPAPRVAAAVPQPAEPQRTERIAEPPVAEAQFRRPITTTDSTEARPAPRAAEKLENGDASTKPPEMKVVNALERNPYLSSRLTQLLPARMTLRQAAIGFKNQKQFIAALHVSRNLGIPFDQLKTRMTVEPRSSLDDSVRELNPDMGKNLAKAEVDKAEAQAKDDEQLAKLDAKKAEAAEKFASR